MSIQLFFQGGLQLLQRFFLNAGDIAAADAALLGDFPLGEGMGAAQAVTQADHPLLDRKSVV